MGALRKTDDQSRLGVIEEKPVDYHCPNCGAICFIDTRPGNEWKFCPIEGKEVKSK